MQPHRESLLGGPLHDSIVFVHMHVTVFLSQDYYKYMYIYIYRSIYIAIVNITFLFR